MDNSHINTGIRFNIQPLRELSLTPVSYFDNRLCDESCRHIHVDKVSGALRMRSTPQHHSLVCTAKTPDHPSG